MSDPTKDSQPISAMPSRQVQLVPALLATDLDRTAAFYAGLGFALEWPDGPERPARRLTVERDGFSLFFFNEPIGALQHPVLSGTLYVFPDNVDALAAEWRGKVEFLWGPELMPYGLYEFGFTDPDGYCLAFAERRGSGS